MIIRRWLARLSSPKSRVEVSHMKRKHLAQIILLAAMLLYFFLAPEAYDFFFLKLGKPVQKDILLPEPFTEARSWIDGLYLYTGETQGVYELLGWAFPVVNDVETPIGEYERLLVLSTSSRNYTFSLETKRRDGVQEAFKDVGMDVRMSGFVSLIAQSSIGADSYRIGVLFQHPLPETLFYVDTGWCLTSTPNNLILEDLGSTSCALH